VKKFCHRGHNVPLVGEQKDGKYQTQSARHKVREPEAKMRVRQVEIEVPGKMRKITALAAAGALAGAMTLAPVAVMANTHETSRISNERVIDRANVENLQRWVSSGHADWCKDARLVVAEELRRLAPDFSGNGFEVNATNDNAAANDGNRATFEWAAPDGRAVYRVTVERFIWLLPIAGDLRSIVWVPTSTEIHARVKL
jgi:hypothetical protein